MLKKQKKRKKHQLKKEKKPIVRKSRKCPYRLIMVCNGVQRASMGAFREELQGLRKMNELSKNSVEGVKFPTRYINKEKIEDVKYALVLIKKREESDPLVTKVRNEYGEYVDHASDNDLWMIVDKAPYEIEETFWVYGYHPLTDRKTYSFIYDELVRPNGSVKSNFLNVKLFLNKVILLTLDSTELITCKNTNDALRLYNKIFEDCSKDKAMKYVCFNGNCNSTSVARAKCIEDIQKLTSWDKGKIIRMTTKTNKTWLASEKKKEREIMKIKEKEEH